MLSPEDENANDKLEKPRFLERNFIATGSVPIILRLELDNHVVNYSTE